MKSVPRQRLQGSSKICVETQKDSKDNEANSLPMLARREESTRNKQAGSRVPFKLPNVYFSDDYANTAHVNAARKQRPIGIENAMEDAVVHDVVLKFCKMTLARSKSLYEC